MAQLRWGVSILAFAVGSFALGYVVIPARRLLAGRGGLTDLDVQRILHRVAGGYLQYLVAIGWIEIEIRDGDRLSRGGPHMVVGNHPSLFDVVLLCSLMPQADCIVSSARTEHFLLRSMADPAGYIRNDDPALLIRECVSRLRNGRSLLVFPEGTRSPPHRLGPFQRGAARIALEAGCEILPVLLVFDPPFLHKGWHWRDLPDRPIHATVRVLEPISAKLAVAGESVVSTSVASRELNAELRELFLKGLEIDDVRNA